MNRKNLLVIFCAALALLLFVILKKSTSSGSYPTKENSTLAVKSPSAVNRPPRARPASIKDNEEITIPAAEQARMERMSENLLKPQLALSPAAAAEKRAEWVARFKKETDPLLRQEIITEMVQLDDPLTIKLMTALLPDEKHPGVRQQIVLILGYMSSTVPEIANVSATVLKEYQQVSDTEERARILEIISNLPTEESVKFMQTAFFANNATAEDRFNAAGGLFKLAPRVKIAPDLLNEVTERLKATAKSAASDEERLQAATALAAPYQDNKAFLEQLLTTETNPKVREFLTLASQKHPTQ
ncbi:MAG: hypothetical protein ACR2H1_00220 [Limisphaerales bacterium]